MIQGEVERENTELEGRGHWQQMPQVMDHIVQWIIKEAKQRVWWGEIKELAGLD